LKKNIVLKRILIILSLFCALGYFISRVPLPNEINKNTTLQDLLWTKEVLEKKDNYSDSVFNKIIYHIGTEKNYAQIGEYMTRNLCLRQNPFMYVCVDDGKFQKIFNDDADYNVQNYLSGWTILNKKNNKQIQLYYWENTKNNMIYIQVK